MGQLTVFLDKATNLKDADVVGKSDPYCTLTLKKDNILKDTDAGQLKSTVKQNNLNPVWGETFTFTLPSPQGYYLHISCKDEDVGKDDMLGWCDIDLGKVEGLGETPVAVEKVIDRNVIKANGMLYLKLSYKE